MAPKVTLRDPPMEAYNIFQKRYWRVKDAGVRLDVRELAGKSASDYLDAYPDCGWEYGDLMRSILSMAGRRGGKAAGIVKRRRKSARERVRRIQAISSIYHYKEA